MSDWESRSRQTGNGHTTPRGNDNTRQQVMVGGVGGSGTRLVSQIFQSGGWYTGPDLNRSGDDLVFSLLFKRPWAFAEAFVSKSPAAVRLLDLHQKICAQPGRLTGRDWLQICRITAEHALHRSYDRTWLAQRLANIQRRRSPPRALRWCCKEPHTVFHLPSLAARYSRAQYILVTRNGLDMAFSPNTQQQRWWGRCFGLPADDGSPRARFEFWYRVNLWSINAGRRLFGSRFTVVRLEDLFRQPHRAIRSLERFAGPFRGTHPATLKRLPHRPASHGRYRRFATSWIDAAVLDKMREVGYADMETLLADT